MKRIQRKRTRGWRMPPNTIYVGRPSKWGNPFDIHDPLLRGLSDAEKRQMVVDEYRQHLLKSPLFLMQAKISLQGHDLACWCPLDQPCHADVLIQEIGGSEMMKIIEIIYIDDPTLITHQTHIMVHKGQNAVVSFIGNKPGNIHFHPDSKVWNVCRCYAEYIRNGVIERVTRENSARLFCDFYGLNVNNGICHLYKRVRSDYRDYFSGEYDYSPGNVVTAIDWIDNERIVCGNALHLCATIRQSSQWNEGGKLLLCSVRTSDMCVFPYRINQVRCREVVVIEDITYVD